MRVRANSFASLFSGCGGFDIGFSRAGFSSLAAFDNDADALANYRYNIETPAIGADLTLGIPEDYRFRGVDAVIAGPPCQGFSTAGRRILEDDRNHLLPLAAELAVRLNPRVILVENVTGAVAGDHKRYWLRLEGILRSGGFRTHSLKLIGTKLGMAQHRTRVILVAWRTGRDANFAVPEMKARTVREALSGVSEAPNHKPRLLDKGSDLWCIANRIKPGQKLSNVRSGPRAVHTWDIPEVFGKVTQAERTLLEVLLRLRRQSRKREFGDADPVSPARLESAFGECYRMLVKSLINKGYLRRHGSSLDLAHTFNGKFRRLHWDAPSPTVDTRFGQPRYFLHPCRNRGLTVREAARLQGFPDSYLFQGGEAAQYRLIGNAVPPPIAQAVGDIAAYLTGRK